jgi:lysozyme
MTQNLIDFIRKWEGVRYNPYLDVAGVATIGVGFTTYLDGTKVTLNDPPLDDIQINRILNEKLEEFSRNVKAILGTELLAILPQNCIDALISFSYNLGCNSLKKSTLLKKIKANKNDLVGIKTEFMKWVNAGGKPVEGLKRRRNAEAEMYIDGILSQYTKRELIKMFAGV